MKERLLLVGAGGFGRVVSEHAVHKYNCAFVDDGFSIGTEVCGLPVIGGIGDLKNLFPEFHKLIVTIGNNELREKIYKTAEELGYEFPNIICESAYISPYAKVGKGCVILNNVVIQNNSEVGDGVILNPGVEIHHDSQVGNYALIYTNSVIRTFATVGDRAWIGSTLTIGNEVVISDDVKIPNGKSIEKEVER